MEKRILQTYSVWAKEELERQIEVSLKTLGIHSERDIRKARRAGDLTIIEGDPNSYPADLYAKRSQIVTMVTARGYRNVIEEFAYTWFNRFVALRYLEIHDFLPHGFRVLSNRSGGVEPEILKNIGLIRTELRLDMQLCDRLKAQGKTEELYRHVLLRQCNALADILPMLFTRENDCLELLLPRALLIGDTVLTRLLQIPEEAFLEDVEIIGWMYQFYVSDKRQQYRDAKTVTKELIPTLTQVFTTNWIVRYMAENSVGRIWLESYPASPLRGAMQYYVDEAERTEEVQRQLAAIRYRNVDPKDLRVIDPCCGSGHILVYVFDLLYSMYEEKGYSSREIPTLILQNNLVGLDVDKRAAQLSAFALVMKARRANSRFFNESYYTEPRVFELQDSTYLEAMGYRQHMTELNAFSEEELRAVTKLVDAFRYGKIIGSLIKVPAIDFAAVERVIGKLENEVVATTFNTEFLEQGTSLLKALFAQIRAMSTKYDVMITNPPYLGTAKLESFPKEYLFSNYPNSKADMSAMIMETPFVKRSGFRAIVNPDSWMFLVSYEKLRKSIISSQTLTSLVHLGLGAFDSTVQTVAFVLRNCRYSWSTTYYRLVDSKNKEFDFIAKAPTTSCSIERFLSVPGYAFVYWLPVSLVEKFNNDTIGKYAISDGQTKTGNNDKYLRLLWEVDNTTVGKGNKWVPHAKGGPFRRWYGNIDTLIDWSESARNHYRTDHVARITPEYLWFKEGLCWNLITSYEKFAVRILTDDSTFNLAAPTIFFNDHTKTIYILGLLNSIVAEKIIRALNPTLNTNIGDIMNQPLVYGADYITQTVVSLVENCLQMSKADWNSFETSWDFKYHPLVELRSGFAWGDAAPTFLLSDAYDAWEQLCEDRFQQLKGNEEELNGIFIDLYGLQKELTPEVEERDVTVRLADRERDIRSLISYLVGVVMGRYSLDVEGLAYAGGDWDASKYRSYQPDDDGIVPIYSELGMEDGLTARIIQLIKRIYGENSYRANIDFIAEALGKKSSESSEETLNRYLNEGFYADHLKIYQKRPIYWLLSSGKNSGFKCLIYMHRYTAETLARINGKYFLPESTRLKNELEELSLRIARSEGRDRVRLEKERQKLAAAYSEALEYGQVLDHMANRYIAIDLDDGVKVNYAKFQGIELVTDSGVKVKKDLLSPVK